MNIFFSFKNHIYKKKEYICDEAQNNNIKQLTYNEQKVSINIFVYSSNTHCHIIHIV